MLLLAQAPVLDRFVSAQKAFDANPKSEERLVALAGILYETGRNERAISLLEPFVKANSRASRARLFLALGYARVEKYSQAKILAAQVASELPNDFYAQHITGLSLFGLNDFAAAETRFKKAIALKNDFADSHFQLGLLYSRNPDTLARALSEYESAIARGYSNAELFRNIGSLNIKLGKYDDAIQHLNQAIALNPDYADAYFQLADAFRKTGKTVEAAEATKKFQSLNSSTLDLKDRQNKGRALYDQGMAWIQQDDLVKAYNAFTSAAEILPQLDAAYYRLSQIDYLRDDNRRAVMNVQKAIALNPFEAEYYFVLGRCLENSNVLDAIDALNKAVSLNGKVADFHNALGNLYEKAGNPSRAVQSYTRAVQLAPKNEGFRANLQSARRRAP